jgi:hypothetical protein
VPRWAILFAAALAAVLSSVAVAAGAAPAPRFVLAAARGGAIELYLSADGVRWTAAPSIARAPAATPDPVVRGSTLYLFDSAGVGGDGLTGSVRRFALAPGAAPAEQSTGTYQVTVADPAEGQRASPGSFVPSFALDRAGALVALYAVRFEPESNACPVAGQACVKLRTATEVAGSDGAAFTGDPSNRAVLSFDPKDVLTPPVLVRDPSGWLAVFGGPGGCLHVLAATDPHGTFRPAPGLPGGCAVTEGPDAPTAVWAQHLREYWLYGVSGGRVVRAATRRLMRLTPARFRPLPVAGPGVTSVRVAALPQ